MILQEYETEDIAEFTGDFIPLIKMASTIDGMIRVDEPTWFSQNMQAFHKCFDLFHKKYRDIKLQIIEGDMFRIRVFFIGTTIKHIAELAIALERVKAAGPSANKVYPAIPENREKILSHITDVVYLTFFSLSKTKAMILKRHLNGDIELLYDTDTITEPNNPDFELCCYFGCLHRFAH